MLRPPIGTLRTRPTPSLLTSALLVLVAAIPWLLPAAARAQITCGFVDPAGEPSGPTFEVVAGTELRLRVSDAAENGDSVRFESLHVEVQATQSGDILDYLQLFETGRGSGVFEALVELEALPASAFAEPFDNTLQTRLTDSVELVYFPSSGDPHCVAVAPVVPAGLELVDERLTGWQGPAEPRTVLADGVLRLRLRAPGQNQDGAVVESLSAAVTSEVNDDHETVTLVETSDSSGVFEGTIQLRTDYVQAGNGVLELVPPYLPEAVDPERILAAQGGTGTHAEADVVRARLVWLDASGDPRPAFVPGEAVALRLDRPLWADSLSVDTLSVDVETDSGDQETLTLVETGPATSIFESTLTTSGATPVSGDGVLQATAPAGGGPGLATAHHSDSYLPDAAEATAQLVGSRIRIPPAFGAGVGEIFQTAPFEVEVLDFDASGSVSIQAASVLAADAESASLPQVAPGLFRGSVATALTQSPNQSGSPGDGTLTTTGDYGPPLDTDEVTVTYTGGWGGPSTDRAIPVGSRSYFLDSAGEATATYGSGPLDAGPARLRVVAPYRNTAAGSVQGVWVNVSVDEDDSNEYEELFLSETGPDTGVFEGELPLDTAMPVAPFDGIFQVDVGEVLGFAHLDDFLSSLSNAFATIAGPLEAARPPVAVDDTATTPEDTAVLIDVLANDSDPNGGPLTVIHAETYWGTVTIEPDGRLRYLPPQDATGTFEIHYEIEDPTGLGAGANVDVTVTPVNDPPIAEISPPFETTGLAPFAFTVRAWSSYDPDGSIVAYEWDFDDGTTASGAQVSHTYPRAGTYSVTLTVTDAEGATGTDTLEIEVIRLFSALFVAAEDPFTGLRRPGDEAFVQQMENAGWELDWRLPGTVQASDADGHDAVVISSTIISSSVGATFRDTPVPVVTWEPFLLDDMGMTGVVAHQDYGSADLQTVVELEPLAPGDPGHALTAGLSGTVILTSSPQRYTFGRPTAAALAVARNGERAERLHLFAYDTGAPMAGLAAPARRVALPLSDDTPTALTTEAWSLVEAAMCWAINCDGEPVARFTATTTAPGSLTIDFDATTSEAASEPAPGASILDWSWDFGDGTVVSGGAGVADTASHTYAAAGWFTVELRVTDSEGRAAGRSESLYVGATGRQALFVVGSVSLAAGDAAVSDRLRGLGFDVTPKGQSQATAADAAGMDLVVISSTIQSSAVSSEFRDVAVPVVVWENYLFDDMGLTGDGRNVDYGLDPGRTSVAIAAPSHPVADGLSGTVALLETADDLRWGIPGAAATVIATSPADAAHAAVFVYESGATMAGVAAPARRVALPYSDLGPTRLTSTGWQLFDAAIGWAVGDR